MKGGGTREGWEHVADGEEEGRRLAIAHSLRYHPGKAEGWLVHGRANMPNAL